MTSSSQSAADPGDLAGAWTLDLDATTIAFRTTALWLFPATGTFRASGGAGMVAPDGGVTGSLVIDAASVATGIKKRDDHLRTADFFDVATYPTITYEATGGQLKGSGTLELTGTLTVHGKTRPLPVTATLDVSATSVTVSAEVGIDRSEWGIARRPFGAGLHNAIVIHARFLKE
jgi:polyisoprenoid-binding protein YceI